MTVKSLPEIHPATAAEIQLWLDVQAKKQPETIALTHHQHDALYAWRWGDIKQRVEQIKRQLIQQGIERQTRLLINGEYTPELLLISLAARLLGVQVDSIADFTDTAELDDFLSQNILDIVYVQHRQQLAFWLASRYRNHFPLTIVSSGLSDVQSELWTITAVDSILEATTPQRLHQSLAPLNVVWVEDNTAWSSGLELIWQQWLALGQTLALPENSQSAKRDRALSQPVKLLLSANRLKHIEADIDNHLNLKGSWRRSIAEWALNNDKNIFAKLLKHHIHKRFGLQQVQKIEHVDEYTTSSLRYLAKQTPLENAA